MLRHYLRVALRTLRRRAGYAAVNVTGLALGLACCLLMFLYVRDEVRFDRSYPHADRLFRIVEAQTSPEGEDHVGFTMGPLGPALEREVPEAEASTRFVGVNMAGRRTALHGERRFYEAEYLFAPPSVFDVFGFTLRRGDVASALAEPRTVVLTESAARRYFGDEDPYGQVLEMEQYGDLRVTGLMPDPPRNTHLDFSMLISWATLETFDGWQRWIDNWGSSGFPTYVRLREGAAPEAVAPKLDALLARHADDETLAARRPALQALADVHFGSGHITFERNRGEAPRTYLYLFSAAALFVLLIACINYMNLATARSMERAREVGLRKVVGAHRRQLVAQFMGESVVVTGLALALALGLTALALPAFNTLADKAMTFGDLFAGGVLPALVGVVLLVGLVSGSYPALYLSRFQPALVLKGAFSDTARQGASAWLRRGLVVTQFTLSILLLVGTLVTYDQLRYVQTKPLGFDAGALVVVDINDGDVRRDFETVKQAFADVPGVRQVSVASNVPGDWKTIPQIEVVPEGRPDDERATTYFLGVDEDFLETFAMDLAGGRGFGVDFGTDSTSVLLNETAARRLGLEVGQTLRVPDAGDGGFEATVAGIVEDFHFHSLHEPIAPMVLGYRSNPIDVIDYFALRVDGRGLEGTLAGLRAVGERFDPEHPFEYNVLEDRLGDFYRTEARVGRIFGLAAGLTILIACLGLFGLAAYTAERRTKEIGVRKVLGASVPGLVGLLSKDFLRLVVVAFVVAAPVAYLAMDRWLAGFAYRTELSWTTFAAAGLTALGIALLTVSYQAVRAAMADPVDSLRYE